MFLRRAAAAFLIVVLAGCSDSSPTASSTSSGPPVSSPASAIPTGSGPPATAPPAATATPGAPEPSARFDGVQVVKTGGIAGVTETTTIKPDGSWNLVSGKGTTGSMTKTGKLSPANLDKVVALAADPRIKTEAARTWPTRASCTDTFSYLLIVGFQMLRYAACPSAGEKPPATVEMINLVGQVTK